MSPLGTGTVSGYIRATWGAGRLAVEYVVRSQFTAQR